VVVPDGDQREPAFNALAQAGIGSATRLIVC
jgi:hypothetical protein